MANLKVRITFPENKILEPIIYNAGKNYKVVTNIRRADVNEKTGWVDLELVGEIEEIEHAIAGMKDSGVKVDPIERNVIE